MIFVWALAVIGFALIYLEFFLPGGIMAIGGAICLLSSLYVFYQTTSEAFSLFLYFLALLALTWIIAKFALWRVRSTAKKGTIYLMNDQEGYQASIYPKELIGKVGLTATDLKPSGHLWVEDQRFQALSKTGYIEKGTSVEILGGQGAHLIVKLYRNDLKNREFDKEVSQDFQASAMQNERSLPLSLIHI